MGIRALFLVLLASGASWADTGFRDMIQVTETDGSPKCMAGQMVFNAGQVTCSGNKATLNITGGGGGGSSLEILAGTQRSSPTATIKFPTSDFAGSVTGSTMSVTLSTNVARLDRHQSWPASQTFEATTSSFTFSGNSDQRIIINHATSGPAVYSDITTRSYDPTFGAFRIRASTEATIGTTGGTVGRSELELYPQSTSLSVTRATTGTGYESGIYAEPDQVYWFINSIPIITATANGVTASTITSSSASFVSASVGGSLVCRADGVNCPTSSGSGSTLAVSTGNASGFVIRSSPTAVVNLSSTTFAVDLTGDATAFVRLILPSTLYYKAAICQSGTASLGFSTFSSSAPTPSCSISTSTVVGVAPFTENAVYNSVQDHFRLPDNWARSIEAVIIWRSSVTTGNVVWQIKTACVSEGEPTSGTWNAASTVTDATAASANGINRATISAVTATNCAAGDMLFFELYRDASNGSDSMGASADLIGLELTFWRNLQ